MTEDRAFELTEDRVPAEGIEETIHELVELYGGEMKDEGAQQRTFILPLRRAMSSGGGVECTVSWQPDDSGAASVTFTSNRDVDAPRLQRILLLAAGVVGAVMFMLWPFYPGERAFGTFAWIGGVIAIAVYLMTLRRTSGGIAADFLQRLASRQRDLAAGE
ncbi:MAG TPA: hypothetical protein VF701_17110 [Thermoanaerobaculia bacterium]